jgi:Rrf2 family protein
MISQTAEYALRAVLFLGRSPETPYTTHQIAESTQMPSGYLSKVLQLLGRAGVVHSQRGLHGGFVLGRSVDELTLLEVVNAVDPLRRVEGCPLGVAAHTQALCPLHQKIDDALATIEKAFREVTLRAILEEESKRKVLCGATGRAEERA